MIVSATVLALALTGCGSESVAPAQVDMSIGDMANRSCRDETDFAKWQLCKYNFTQNVARSTPAHTHNPAPQRASQSESHAAGELLMLIAGGLLNGYAQGQREHFTCSNIAGIIDCR
jgi:hypothetical protein